MHYSKCIVIAIVICFAFRACGITENRRTDYFGFSINEFELVEEEDTHGGFLGDGSYYLILDCSKKSEQAKALIQNWMPLPLTENLQLIMYGGTRDGVGYAFDFAEEAHWPTITNGVYKFVDRHDEAVNPSDDTNLFTRGSFNFSIAVYDLDTHTLYYFEMDT